MADDNEARLVAAEKLREVQFAIQNEQHRHADELHRLGRDLRAAQTAMAAADPTWTPPQSPYDVKVIRSATLTDVSLVDGKLELGLADVEYEEADRG